MSSRGMFTTSLFSSFVVEMFIEDILLSLFKPLTSETGTLNNVANLISCEFSKLSSMSSMSSDLASFPFVFQSRYASLTRFKKLPVFVNKEFLIVALLQGPFVTCWVSSLCALVSNHVGSGITSGLNGLVWNLFVNRFTPAPF